jgi:ferredoxin-NADP reductase
VARREYEDAARAQCSFYLEPHDGCALPAFKPGQFLTFKIKPPKASGTGVGEACNVVRCYSLSDRPDPAQYRITVKRALPPVARPDLPPGYVSGHFHDHVQVGDVLQIKAPAGQFFIDPDYQIPVVLIAGGIGITPMMSMLLWSLDECPGRAVYLYYGALRGAEQAFKPVLEKLAKSNPNFHLTVVYEKPAPDDEQGRDFHHAGYVNVDLLRCTLPHRRHQFYVCGPPAMMASVISGLREWGIPPQDIFQEAFGPASVHVPRTASGATSPISAERFEVSFRRSGRTISWDGEDANLLDFAERHGVEVEFGCRSGSCGTCETKLVWGTVHYALRPDHEIAPGTCLLCVGTPGSALVLEA